MKGKTKEAESIKKKSLFDDKLKIHFDTSAYLKLWSCNPKLFYVTENFFNYVQYHEKILS